MWCNNDFGTTEASSLMCCVKGSGMHCLYTTCYTEVRVSPATARNRHNEQTCLPVRSAVCWCGANDGAELTIPNPGTISKYMEEAGSVDTAASKPNQGKQHTHHVCIQGYAGMRPHAPCHQGPKPKGVPKGTCTHTLSQPSEGCKINEMGMTHEYTTSRAEHALVLSLCMCEDGHLAVCYH